MGKYLTLIPSDVLADFLLKFPDTWSNPLWMVPNNLNKVLI